MIITIEIPNAEQYETNLANAVKILRNNYWSIPFPDNSESKEAVNALTAVGMILDSIKERIIDHKAEEKRTAKLETIAIIQESDCKEERQELNNDPNASLISFTQTKLNK